MNKKEAIEKIKEYGEFYDNVFAGTVKAIPVGPVIDIISQIDEPQKVVVPKFVAEWIEVCKNNDYGIVECISNSVFAKMPENVIAWFDSNSETEREKEFLVATAYINGYEVEVTE